MKFITVLVVILLLLLCHWLLIDFPHFESDDAYIIYLTSTLDWYHFLYVPEIYQQLSAAHLTPFAVPFYTLIQEFFPFSPGAYLNIMVILLALWMFSCVFFLKIHFRLPNADMVLFGVLILSVSSIGTILNRFYTSHYLLSGILGTVSLIALSYYSQTRRSVFYWIATVLMILALMSKEIMIAILPISFFLFLQNRFLAKKIFITGIFIVVGYFAYRGYMLEQLIGTRVAKGGLTQGLVTIYEALPGFIDWYISGRVLLSLALIGAFFLSPLTVLAGLVVAVMLAAPTLAAPHGYSYPELHADRLFIASDFALAATATLGFARWRQQKQHFNRPMILAVVGGIVIAGFARSLYQTNLYDEQVPNSSEYRITQTILERHSSADAIYFPENYVLGSLVAALKHKYSRPHEITANCLEALQWSGGNILLLNHHGQIVSHATLAENCSSMDFTPSLSGDVIYDRGILHWDIVGAEHLEAGVYFQEHALYIGNRQFQERLIRPSVGEKYKLYAKEGTHWWFSEEKEVVFR
ncbi:hypothetical protein [Nitrosomonas sp. PY1]|uniref:hypothetical protein n=1 Tax=Nitrosomonas sp. PY1 TaxID=1803906 RepID=UPI001FC7DDDA|nr:hypothetical protein [Nitrosomonas sp. PY1]